MRKTVTLYLWLAFLPAVLGGCGLGFSKSLFVTKSNLGFDIDTQPPTVEIGIARREVAITPAFEGGQVLPLFASFGTTQDGFDRFAYGLSSLFAGGEAAVALAKRDPRAWPVCRQDVSLRRDLAARRRRAQPLEEAVQIFSGLRHGHCGQQVR